MNIKTVSVILPFYHETIDELQQAIEQIVDFFEHRHLRYEILVSHNGSREPIIFERPHVTIIHDPERGLGRAIKNAAEAAVGEYIYFLSLEIPFYFSDVPAMLEHASSYDLLIGSKLHSQSVYRGTFFRKCISTFFSYCTFILFPSFRIQDPNGTLFGRTDMFQHIARQVRSNDFFFNTEFVYRYIKNGLRVHEVPVTYIQTSSRSSVRLLDGIRYFLQLVWLRITA